MLTFKQKFIRLLYPMVMRLTNQDNKNGKKLYNTQKALSKESIFNLELTLSNGTPLSLEAFRGKKILFVNVASNCGFTAQYTDLEALYQAFKHKLCIVGIPTNDFKQQEPKSDAEIAQFCTLGYGVTFPILKKQSVLKPNQQALYKWLTDPAKNGWCEQEPVWNFSKYLVNENGQLLCFLGPSISPASSIVHEALSQ
ncbi:MAG: glutathione peroxidase [Cytophagales bacterium]|nr:MAG: glutathione peroxidase [Cytophagales bacterium]